MPITPRLAPGRALSLALFVPLAFFAARADADPTRTPVRRVPTPAPAPGPSAAPAPAVTADDWLRIGLERYERGNFVGAIEAFERGQALSPRPALVFAIAQAHRRRGDCTRARAYFDAFLATASTPQQIAAARDQRDRCVDAPAPPPAPAQAAPGPAIMRAPSPRSSAPTVWRDPIGLAAGGTGLALLGTTVALFVSAGSAADDAAVAPDHERHRVLRERAETRQLLGTITLAAGVTAGAVTAWRIWRLRDHGPRESREPALSFAPIMTLPSAREPAAAVGIAARGSF